MRNNLFPLEKQTGNKMTTPNSDLSDREKFTDYAYNFGGGDNRYCIIPVVRHEAVVIGGKEAVPLATYEVARSNSIMSVTHQKFRIHILGLMSCN
ncbi:MAG: hypothetical protein J6I86_08285 [Bacteroidaceae bacterium]|nr:hypothetical protein [Bacteroidaceae bacterium]